MDDVARPPVPDPVPAPDRRRWRPTGGDVAVALVVLVVVALPVRALFIQRGSPMEEGFMLVFPERILEGDVPHRDFLHLYGPGSLWVLAAVYRVAGVTIEVERAVGLLQVLGIAAGVVLLARPFGRTVAAGCGAIAAMLALTSTGLAALAWNGGVALALLALASALRARRLAEPADGAAPPEAGPPADRRADRWWVVAGLLGAAAVLYRLDLVLAVGLALGAALWGTPRRVQVRALAPLLGLLAVGYGGLALWAGPGNAVRGLFIEPVFELRDGRSLPVPPSGDRFDGALAALAQLVAPGWSLPALPEPREVQVWFFLLVAAVVLEVGYAAWRVRRRPGHGPDRALLAMALLGLGILPQALQRPDATHLAWVSCVPLALVPLFVAEAVRGRERRRPGVLPEVVGVAVAAVLFVGVIPLPTVRMWLDATRQSVLDDPRASHAVVRGDRTFYLGAPGDAQAANDLVADLARRSEPGQRLLVGTGDLRFTPYSDAYLYHLLPELTPATRYIEMDPGVANAADSGLADEVASADWVVLSLGWDFWDEPNGSGRPGSDAPNQVLARDFCLVEEYGASDPPYLQLYQRCR